ncbi:MAG: hypothetical protein JJT89_10475 [Nitriliruptoraceae bacterium]|nr:hypothetical protein [Nitriliruptoraceae bacterium]
MSPADISPARAWAQLLADVADEVVLDTVEDMHRTITDRASRPVEAVLGEPARLVRAAIDRSRDAAYAGVRLGVHATSAVVASVLEARTERDSVLEARTERDSVLEARTERDSVLEARTSPVARRAQAIANGVAADRVRASAPTLALTMTLRRDGHDVEVEPTALAAAFPDAHGHVVVLVHGLVDTEAVWGPAASEGTVPHRIRAAGATPAMVCYGTGDSIDDSGARLSVLLEGLVASWPVPVDRLTIVAHSMGGLVTRAACRDAAREQARWLDRLAAVVYLGTPHLGSWLEKVANVGTWGLRRDRVSAPIGRLIDNRSLGIKQLRFGTTDRSTLDPEAIDDLLSGLVRDEPWLDRVAHHLVVGRLRDGRHPLNLLLGDGLVRAGSATGIARRRRIEASTGHLSITTVHASHTALPRHPTIVALIGDIVAGTPAAGATADQQAIEAQ